MCMFHGLPMWMFIPIMGLIIGLIFAIPIYDWIKRKTTKAQLNRTRFVRYDGLVATDIKVINNGKEKLILREIGTYREDAKEPVEKQLAIEILPGTCYAASYINAQQNWYVLLEKSDGTTITLT